MKTEKREKEQISLSVPAWLSLALLCEAPECLPEAGSWGRHVVIRTVILSSGNWLLLCPYIVAMALSQAALSTDDTQKCDPQSLTQLQHFLPCC